MLSIETALLQKSRDRMPDKPRLLAGLVIASAAAL